MPFETYHLEGILHVKGYEFPRNRNQALVGKRFCVTGGRFIRDETYVWQMLDTLHGDDDPIIELGAGCAAGVDEFSLAWAAFNGVSLRCYHADWERYGRAAGAMRNEVMLQDFSPDVLVVYDGGTGTADCTRRARKMGIDRIFAPSQLGDDPFEQAKRWG